MFKILNLSKDRNLLTEIFPYNVVNQSAQQIEAWKQQAIDQVTTSLGQSLQAADQIKNTTSTAIETAIASGVNDWVGEHPAIFRFLQILNLAANHPIISLVLLLLAIAVASSIIKAIVRLIETASWSILQVPLKLLLALIKVSFQSFIKVTSLAIKQFTNVKISDPKLALLPATYEEILENKQQRLTEIAQRLEILQTEQKQLLQEAALLIDTDTIEIKKLNVN